MLTLYKFGSAWGEADMSPFCGKVETYLRMMGIPFEPAIGDSRKAPKGKLPYIVDGGTKVADSRDIIAHLEASAESPLDGGITPAEQALSVAYRGLLEEEGYFLLLYQRWKLDSGWTQYVPRLRQYAAEIGVPSFAVPLMLPLIRKQVVGAVDRQGAGRHTPEQIEARGKDMVDAVAQQLGDGPYFLGERPRVIDTTVFAFMAGLMGGPFQSECKAHALAQPNLCAYVERIKRDHYAS